MGKIHRQPINEFREKFGDLLLSCDNDTLVDAEDPIVPVGYGDDTDLVDATQVRAPVYGQLSNLLNSFSDVRDLDTLGSFSPMVIPQKRKACHDRDLQGSGAIFHNQAGDLHSPMIQWETKIPHLFDESTTSTLPNVWDALRYLTPLAQTQHDTVYDQLGCKPLGNKHSVFNDNIAKEVTRLVSSNHMTGQRESKIHLPASQAGVSSVSSHDNNEQFRYNVTSQAPTAMLQSATERAITYLNKGRTYSLSVLAPAPSKESVPSFEYKTSVRVTFEEEEQRSNPIASWQLWKVLMKPTNAKGQLAAVEFVDLSQASAEYQDYQQVRLEKASIDGFCVTWTADPDMEVHQCTISLRFNFLSTDFSRSKGVKGVPVRLSAKTRIIRPVNGRESREHDPEICYCLVKLFRDHGAERKMSNDVAHVKKTIEKLNHKITSQRQRRTSGQGTATMP